MFISCPHCRDLVATDRHSGLPPALCPRCGGALREPDADDPVSDAKAGNARSFVSFLRGGAAHESADDAAETAPSAPVVEAAARTDAAPEIAMGASARDDRSGETHGDETPTIANDAVEPDPIVPPAASVSIPQPIPAPEDGAPSFIRMSASSSAPHPRVAKWQWAAVLVLALSLGVQVLVADRARLAADADWRPLISTLCGVLGCEVPAWHQPGAIAMLSRDVSPVTGSAGGLDVRATFRNDARWPQPWPVLLLSLSDADGRVLGSRAFTPREYLGADATQTELAPGQSARISLRLHEPNPDVVAFSFDFR